MKAKIKKKFPLELPEKTWKLCDSIAKDLSIKRTKANAENGSYAEGTDKWRGDKEQQVSYQGIMGELLHRAYWIEQDVDPNDVVWFPLVDDKPVVGPDAIIKDQSYDAKLSNKYYKDKYTGEEKQSFKLQVSADAHNNVSKSVDQYFFVQADVSKMEADIYVVDHENVDDWDEMQYASATLEADIPRHILMEDYWDDEDDNS